MTTISTPSIETTVGELVAQRPGRSRVFQQLGIDFCCGGKKSLAEACGAKGLDPSTVLTTLLAAEQGAVSDERNWMGESLTSLADHIEQTHHAYLRQELPRLSAMVRKVAMVHGDRYPWMREIDSVFIEFAGELLAHMTKEERIVFPMIRALETGQNNDSSLSGPIQAMEAEHDGSGDAMKRMSNLSSGYTPPADACNTFRAALDGLAELEADMHQHVHKENNILFPRALALEQHTRGA